MNKKDTHTNNSLKEITLAPLKKANTLSKKQPGFSANQTKIPVTQYVLPLGNGWIVKNSRAAKFIFISDSKKEAITLARGLAQTKHTELVVHGKNGNIEIKESYIV